MSRKLHIGGQIHVEGWEVLNANAAPYVDHVCNAANLSQFPNDTFSEIYASHVVEHFDYATDLLPTLREWCRVLMPGGRLCISVPDMDVLAKLFLSKDTFSLDERFLVMRMIFGGHIDQYDYHAVGLNEEFLSDFLFRAGYTNIKRVDSFGYFQDTSNLVFKGFAISLNIIAEKSLSAHTANSSTDRTLNKALELQQQGDLNGASLLFKEILNTDPEHVFALCSLGIIAVNTGKLTEALSLIDRAIGISTDFAPAFFCRGAALQGLQRYEEALVEYERALKVQPDYSEAQTKIGIIRSQLNHIL